MANTALAHSTFEQISSLSQMHIVRQMGFMLLLAAGIALGVAVVMWSREPDYAVLYPDLPAKDAGEVMSALDQSGISYRLDQRSGLVSVPSGQLQQARLQLASQGLPRNTSEGFDMLYQDSSIGTSNFVEQARYTRALEQELVKTVKLIRGVRDARVHLSIPKQTTFLRSGNKASASVMLDVIAGQLVSDTQIAGIAHLVASSVTGLAIENVSIVDQKGSLLSKRQDSDFASSSEQLQYTRNLEQQYTQRIIDILSPVVGEGRVRAQVAADLDFTIIETTEENYNPSNVVVRSEQTSQEARNGGLPLLPGALAPNPPEMLPDGSIVPPGAIIPAGQVNANALANAENTQTRSNLTRNYEIDKSVSYIRSVPGGVKRLSVAVLVDLGGGVAEGDDGSTAPPVDAERLARLTQLVKDTIGYSEGRGDSVNLINERFTAGPVFEEASAPQIWEQDWVPGLLKQFAAGIVILLLIFSVLKPALKSVVAPPDQKKLPPGQTVQLAAETRASELPPPAQELSQMTEYDQNLTRAQSLVENEPARAARMIREWVAND